MTEKKKYEKPSMQVFELKQQTQLLAGSGGDIPNSDPYTPGGDPFSF
jgi:hypothetical protein